MPKPKKAKSLGGRPTDWRPEYNDELVKFFSVEPNREVEVNHRSKDGKEWTTYELRANKLPKFHEFASHINVNQDTLNEWQKPENVKKYPGFSEAYKKAKELQKWMLIENALQSLYHPTFSIFTAKNITDMRDVVKQEHSGENGGGIKFEIQTNNGHNPNTRPE